MGSSTDTPPEPSQPSRSLEPSAQSKYAYGEAAVSSLARNIDDAVNRAGITTGLGDLLLTYLPDHVDTLLHTVATHRRWWEPPRAALWEPVPVAGEPRPVTWEPEPGYYDGAPYVALVSLLLAAQPPLVDAAVRASQQAPANQLAGCVLRLLEVAPERPQERQLVQDLAREVAGPQSPAPARGRRQVLAWLLRTDAYSHLDLAFEALHSSNSELACVGLEGISRTDPAQGLVAAKEAALQGDYRIGLYALGFLKCLDFHAAHPLLQLCVASAKDSEVRLRALKTLLEHDWDGRDSYVSSLLAHRAVQVRRVAIEELARRGETAIPLIASYLRHPRAWARLAATMALLRIGGVYGQFLVEGQLARELSQRVRREMLAALGRPLPPEERHEAPLETPDAVVSEAQQALKRARWRVGAYLASDDVLSAQGLRWRTGDPVPAVATHYLLYCQSRITGWYGRLDARADQILALVERASANEFAQALFDAWLRQGAPARESWCLPLICALGDAQFARTVLDLVGAFELQGRGSRVEVAKRALQALTLADTDEITLSRIGDIASGIDRSHHRPIVEVAHKMLHDTAQHREIPYEELLDRAATRPSWDAARSLTFDVGDHTYTAQFTSNLLWHIRDDAGTRLRALPKPRVDPGSDYTTYSANNQRARQAYTQSKPWRALRQQVREAVKLQAARLERTFGTERMWSVAAWQEIFLRHPLMRLLATNLVWELGDAERAAGCAESAAAVTFRPTDEGTLVAADGHIVALPAEGSIGLVHPLRLDDDLRQAWKRSLTRAHRHPPFRQMDRPVSRVRPEERDLMAWTRDVRGVTAWRTLERRGDALGWAMRGWNPMIMCKTFPWKGPWTGAPLELEAQLEGKLERGMTRIERLTFRLVPLSDRSSYRLPTETQHITTLPLGEAPPVVFSEAVLDAARMIGASRVDQ